MPWLYGEAVRTMVFFPSRVFPVNRSSPAWTQLKGTEEGLKAIMPGVIMHTSVKCNPRDEGK